MLNIYLIIRKFITNKEKLSTYEERAQFSINYRKLRTLLTIKNDCVSFPFDYEFSFGSHFTKVSINFFLVTGLTR